MEKLMEFILPEELKNITLPDPKEVEYYKLAKCRTFFIDYEIEDDYRLLELAKTIIRMNVEEKDIPENELQPVYIYIMSFGGDLSQANFVCDLFEASRIPIITIATGAVMSAGFLLFLAGKRRYAFEHSSLLVHEGSAAFEGSAEEIREAQKNYQRQLDQMKEYILSHTKIDVATFNKNRKKDWYLTQEELEKYNIATIIKTFAEIK